MKVADLLNTWATPTFTRTITWLELQPTGQSFNAICNIGDGRENQMKYIVWEILFTKSSAKFSLIIFAPGVTTLI
jgi:hypothetical protein